MFLMTAALTAQVTPQNAPPPPPELDAPDHWEIHGPEGATGFEFTADYWYNDGWCDVFVLEITGEIDGEPYSSVSIAWNCGNGESLDVWNEDSGNTTTWEWEGDHYNKVGGTSNTRTYHPVY
ncbi:MAG: hypothetical protein ACI89X_001060 [Planctomycetota bacterium]|jgi:hypothetical protein